MKRIIVLLFCCVPLFCFAVNDTLYTGIENSRPVVYHIVTAKQNLFRIAKHYQVSMTELKTANNLKADSIKTGQQLFIPLTIKNFTQDVVKTGDAAQVMPVYYVCDNSDNLKQIAISYFNILPEELMRMNKLKSKNLVSGSMLKVGWMMMVPYPPIATMPPLTATAAKARAAQKPVNTDGESIKPTNNTVNTTKLNNGSMSFQKPKVDTIIVRKAAAEKNNAPAVSLFEKMFEQQSYTPDSTTGPSLRFGVDSTGHSSMPKGMYALNNTLPTGSIVKVKYHLNNRVVYVKILGKIPDILGNQNCIIKLSAEAARELDVLDERFLVTIYSHPK